jgi:VWFA-related protein
MRSPHLLLPLFALLAATAVAPAPSAVEGQDQPQAFKFRTGVELVNVNATVTDQSGRFVPGLNQNDFRVYDDETLQPVTHFNPERVPVSLGILLDTSGSMDGEKIVAARAALDRFLNLLSDPKDEVFLYRFDNNPQLVEGWTYDKRQISAALSRVTPHGGTAMYDTLVEALQLVQQGHNTKKALVIISDGNDTSSHTDVYSVKQLIRETEALVYAIGIDSDGSTSIARRQPPAPMPAAFFQRGSPPRPPMPSPFPIPGRKPAPPVQPQPPISNPNPPGKSHSGGSGNDDRVNVAALRDITDDSGGRTEIVRFTRDLDPATTGIADELSRQYYLGYPAPGPKDGRWHSIRVEVRNPAYHVRARRGYVAAR